MQYRGTVQDGVIVSDPGVSLPEGQAVLVVPVPSAGTEIGELPGFGIWRDRTDLDDDSAIASLELRRQAERRDR